MSANKIIKSVSFNLTNADDDLILKAVKRRNFSGYVKKLILADLKSKSEVAQEICEEVAPEEIPEETKPLTIAERLELAKLRQKSGQ